MRIDWNALEFEYVEAGNEVTIESLALKHGIPIARLSRRAEKDELELCQALFRRRMKIPQKTYILERTSAEWDKKCQDAFALLAAKRQE